MRLPVEVKERLAALSDKTGRPSAFYVRQAVEEYLDDLEDAYAADEAYRAWQADGCPTRALSELAREVG